MKSTTSNHLPIAYLSWGCSCYLASEVEGFIKEGAHVWYENEQYFVHSNQVDESALIEYRKLQKAIEVAKEPIAVRIRQGYQSRQGKDWSNLSGRLFGSTTLVMVNFGNKRQFQEISHRDLVLA